MMTAFSNESSKELVGRNARRTKPAHLRTRRGQNTEVVHTGRSHVESSPTYHHVLVCSKAASCATYLILNLHALRVLTT